MSGLKQSLQLKLLQKLSPQQIQLMKLLQVPTLALDQRIKQEIEENPALEEGDEEDLPDDQTEDTDFSEDDAADVKDDDDFSNDDNDFDINDYLSEDDDTPGYKLSANNSSPDDDRKDIPYAASVSFHDSLISQVGLKFLKEDEYIIAMHIIGNLDDAGYMQRELSALVDDMAFSQNITTTVEELENILQVIQELDPPGVGARNLRECLLLQIERKKATSAIMLAFTILDQCFEEFTHKHYTKIIKKLDISEEQLKSAVEEILKLNPKPGNASGSSTSFAQHVVPDFMVSVNDGVPELALNNRNMPDLKVSRTYVDMMKEYASGKTREDKEAVLFLKQKVDAAKWFIDALKQRHNTLYFIMKAIMDYQYEYFAEGDETLLKPMILKDIADIVGLDISTISRVTSNKYVQTPYGTFLIKTFFAESIANEEGEEISTREVKKILQDSIEEEDKKNPVTDEKLQAILKTKGYPIARRTVAKYREMLGIPVARLRKEL